MPRKIKKAQPKTPNLDKADLPNRNKGKSRDKGKKG